MATILEIIHANKNKNSVFDRTSWKNRFFLFICAEPENLRKKINIFTIGTRYQPSFDYLHINL